MNKIKNSIKTLYNIRNQTHEYREQYLKDTVNRVADYLENDNDPDLAAKNKVTHQKKEFKDNVDQQFEQMLKNKQ